MPACSMSWQQLAAEAWNDDASIVITGAAGWAGRTLLDCLARDTELLRQGRVHAFAREERRLEVRGQAVQLRPLHEALQIRRPVALLAPFAFLTRDRVSEFGVGRYIDENSHLLGLTSSLIHALAPKRVIAVSSGAAARVEGDGVAAEPYGLLKRAEESVLREACDAVGASLAVGRLWGASGYTMIPAAKYALSDFILQGLQATSIRVRASHMVQRRYVDMAQFLEVLLLSSDKGSNLLLDSGGPLIEIGELAALIGSMLGKPTSRPDLSDEPVDSYFPNSDAFERAAANAGLTLLTIEQQLAATILGHRDWLSRTMLGASSE